MKLLKKSVMVLLSVMFCVVPFSGCTQKQAVSSSSNTPILQAPSLENIPSTASSQSTSSGAVSSTAQAKPAIYPGKDWVTKKPVELGFNQKSIDEFDKYYKEQTDPNLHGVIIMRGGYIVYENYKNGYTKDSLNDVWSVTKSMTGAVVGTAVDDGLIDVKKPFLSYYPKLKLKNTDARKQNVTVENVLSMHSGLDLKEKMNDMVKSYNTTVQAYFETPMYTDPGTTYSYDSNNGTLMTELVQTVTKKPFLDYAREKVMDPIGMGKVQWDVNDQKIPKGGFGLKITARDMLRFGWLYMNKGKWGNKQIVSEDWVNTSVQSHGNGYGYLWINNGSNYRAFGSGQNYILCYPDYDTVVVFTNLIYDDKESLVWSKMVQQRIEPMLMVATANKK